MILREEVVVECDVPTCHAELVIASGLLLNDLAYLIEDREWKVSWAGLVPFFTCPQCAEEGKADASTR